MVWLWTDLDPTLFSACFPARDFMAGSHHGGVSKFTLLLVMNDRKVCVSLNSKFESECIGVWMCVSVSTVAHSASSLHERQLRDTVRFPAAVPVYLSLMYMT